jgi:cytochrome c553
MGAPLLEGQPAAFLAGALADYKDGKRKSPSMDPNVGKLTKRDMAELGAYFASRPVPAHGQAVDAAKAALGEARVKELGCASCHGAGFVGADKAPRLAGQMPVYLAMELDHIAARRRAHPAVTLPAAGDIEGVAHYLGSLR